MAVVIRMRRTGRKNRPCYRINVSDSRFPRDGRLIETLGLYDPIRRDETKQITLDVERARFWLGNGAKPSDTVASIFRRHGIVEKPAVKRERPGRTQKTSTHTRREEAKGARAQRKLERSTQRKKDKRAAAAATAAAAPQA
jgi:small subunit ribosomal protein S16